MLITKNKVLFAGLMAATLFSLMGLANSQLGLSCSIRVHEMVDPYGGGIDSNEEYRSAVVWDRLEWCEPIALVLIPLMLLIPFSLLTYKLREEVFQAWMHFAYGWIPLSIIVTLPLSLGGGGGGFGMNLIHPEAIAMFFAGIFALISLIIIAWKYFSTRNLSNATG